MRKTIKKTCLECTKEFDGDLREHKRGNARFCSKSCSSKFNGRKHHKPNCKCAVCDKEFYRPPSKLISKSGLYFCTQQCKCNAQTIGSNVEIKEIQPAHYDTTDNYRVIANRYLPQECNRCGYKEYPIVLEVHHKDCDHNNNVLENLEILCPTCHGVEHLVINKFWVT